MAAREFPYLYPDSAAEAERHRELTRWQDSHRVNIACKKAIEEAIRRDFDGTHLKPDCAKSVLEEYGFKRVNFVLANTLQGKRQDGRFSQENKLWGERIYVPSDQNHNDQFTVESHPAVLDDFINQTRQAYQALGLFGPEHCAGSRHEQDYKGKVLVLSPDTLRETCWTPRDQLWLAEGGFGCSPHARGQAVYATCLGDGEKTRWNRSDFAGVLDGQYLPDWAREKLEELRGSQQEQDSGPVMGGMS